MRFVSWMSSCTTEGSDNVEMSHRSSVSCAAIFRRMRLMILPLRVLDVYKRQEQEAVAAAAAAAPSGAGDSGGDTVYITNTGKKYHRDGCSSLSKSKIPKTRSEAEAMGLEPCKNCRP